jgi:hypothetical protein
VANEVVESPVSSAIEKTRSAFEELYNFIYLAGVLMKNVRLNQHNKFGDNLMNSKKQIINKYRAQGFIVGVIAAVITKLIVSFIYQWLVNNL